MTKPTVGNILIVDDEELIRTTLSIKLDQDGYTTKTVESGENALKVLKSESFDVVLTDLRMIGMDGIELLRQVKRLQPDIEVIILTGYASLESAIEALRNEAYDYLLKPINDSKLRILLYFIVRQGINIFILQISSQGFIYNIFNIFPVPIG